MTPEETAALDVARQLASAGVPIFVAPPDPSTSTGYRLPSGWQTTHPDPAALDAWRPGWAVCAVMGQGLDLVDVDPRNGGTLDALNGTTPTVYAAAATPSGGTHMFVRSLGVRSRDNVLPGIDVKAGDADGQGRGFAFIAPTVKPSKVTQQPVAYRWIAPPDLEELSAAGDDLSGAALAELVRAAHGPVGSPVSAAVSGDQSQDAVLRDLAWRLRAAGVDEPVARQTWTAVAAGMPLLRPGEPWTDQDFARHWSGAHRKIGADEAAWAALGVDARMAAAPPLALPAAAPKSRLHSQILALDTLRGDPPATAPYVLEDLVREGDLVALTSPAKAGKSLLVLDRVLAACAAGRRIAYLDAENGLRDIHTRVHALGYRDNLSDNLLYVSFPSLALDKPEDAAELRRFLDELIADGPLDLVVLDTASRFLAGNENDSEPWLAMYRQAFLPIKRAGVAALRLDHLGKDITRGARGSSAKQGDVDVELELAAEESAPGIARITLTCTMQRSGTYERFLTLIRATHDGVLGHRKVGVQIGDSVVWDPGDEGDRINRELDAKGAANNISRAAAAALVNMSPNARWLRRALDRRGSRPETNSAQSSESPEYETDKRYLVRHVTSTDQPLVSDLTSTDQPGTEPPENGASSLVSGVTSPDQHLGQSGPVTTLPLKGESPADPTSRADQPVGYAPGAPVAESAKIAAKLIDARDTAGSPACQPTPADSPPAPPPAPKRSRLTDAEKAARAAAKTAAKAEALAERISEAAGPVLELPAVVTADGTVRPILTDGIAELAATFGWDAELTVDVEHTGYPIGHADYALRTVQLGDERAAVVLDAADPGQLAVARALLERAEILHAHSATADLIPLAIAGALDIERAWDVMHDTVIPAKLADPASTGPDPDLKRLAATVLGERALSPAADAARGELFKAGRWLTKIEATTPLERSGWAQADPRCETMIRYAAGDVLDDAALARRLPEVPPAVLERERLAQRMTARVAHRGLRIDGGHVAVLLDQQRDALADAAARLAGFGVDNPGSDVQVGAVAVSLGARLPATKTGRVSVARGALEAYRDLDTPLGAFVRARLDYQKAETALGLFLEPYTQLVTRGDGRARPTVYTLSADTGRMSCVRPNLQQVPRAGGFRACITADPGQLLVSADFAGVELRVAAALSGDSNLRRLIAEEDAGQGDGVHWAIARLAFGPEATKADRYAVKRGVFGRIYGGGIAAIAAGVGVSETVAAAIVDALDAMLPELSAWSAEVRRAIDAGHTRFPTYSGRVVHMPAGRSFAGPNYAIQGTARELLVDTLVRLRDTRWGEATLLPVHDELVIAVPEDEAEAATAALVAAMQTELHGVAIRAEASEPSFAWKDSE